MSMRVLSCMLLLSSCFCLPAHAQKQQGIDYAAWWSGRYSEPGADQALDNLAATGADWLGLVVTRYQATTSSTVIYSTSATPTDADLIHVINRAR